MFGSPYVLLQCLSWKIGGEVDEKYLRLAAAIIYWVALLQTTVTGIVLALVQVFNAVTKDKPMSLQLMMMSFAVSKASNTCLPWFLVGAAELLSSSDYRSPERCCDVIELPFLKGLPSKILLYVAGVSRILGFLYIANLHLSEGQYSIAQVFLAFLFGGGVGSLDVFLAMKISADSNSGGSMV
jgi:hypothetical protein